MVWGGKNKVAVLEPDEIEMLGFPNNHTEGVGSIDIYKSLGNSFHPAIYACYSCLVNGEDRC